MSTLRKLRRLVLRDGVSVREASRRLGISRNTASKWLSEPEMREPKYPKRVKVVSVLGPFEETLARWLKADQHRNKRERRGIKAMFEALRAMGYGGSRGPVYRFAQQWRLAQDYSARGAGFVPLSFELGEAFQAYAHEVTAFFMDTPSLSTRRRNFLNVLTLITPDHLAEKFSSVAVNVAQFSV